VPQLRFAPLLSAACLLAACDSSPADDAPSIVAASPESVYVPVGMSALVQATVTNEPAGARLEWRTVTPGIAAVDDVVPGVATNPPAKYVRGVAAGTTVLVVEVAGRPGSADTVRVTVSPPMCLLAGILLSPQTPVLDVGGTVQFRATVPTCNGVPRDTTVTWRSSVPAVATVDSTGLATALAPGQTIIFAASRANPAVLSATTLSVR
jgi:hypothetical protein